MAPLMNNNMYKENEEIMTDLSKFYEEMRSKNESKFLAKIREIEKKIGFQTPIKWKMVVFLLITHTILLTWLGYNLWNGIYIKWQTILFAYGYAYMGGFGVTAGAHRYWSHRSYKATPPMRWMLGIMFSIANAYKLYDWIRDHRVHHRFSETSADPHDASRGFFFSHMGWLMMKKHPDVIREGNKVDMTDVSSDPVVQFNSKNVNSAFIRLQAEYHLQLKLIFCVIVPISIPPLFWGETWGEATLAHILAMHSGWHSVWSVNSFAHLYGSRPYNPNINPAQCWLISLVAVGEGWHNYHHTFPWDYKAAELPYFINLTTLLLDGFAKIGLVSHRKFASPQLVKGTIERNCTEKSES